MPTVGAGTVNTEFEVLTGMRQRDFGVCEYPYKTVLKSTTSESVCNDLASIGYKSHCVHNNNATSMEEILFLRILDLTHLLQWNI